MGRVTRRDLPECSALFPDTHLLKISLITCQNRADPESGISRQISDDEALLSDTDGRTAGAVDEINSSREREIPADIR
jgi:hypothetical protein